MLFRSNHDQVGTRALGDRLHHFDSVTLAEYRGASTLLLSLPMTPLLFQGQEWAASTPFPFFSDHAGELGQMVTEGRQREFAYFSGFSTLNVPDPQAAGTFESAKLNWAERGEGEHGRTLALYRHLLRLRREDPVLRERSRRFIRAGAVDTGAGEALWVRWETPQGVRALLWNLTHTPLTPGLLALPFALPPEVLLHSEGDLHAPAALGELHLSPGEAALLAGPVEA